ncbi:PilW family protein [Rhizobacter sp. SG703]|uniref:PilW family protein n=1 Tax=Rhizobacter sp. SG703 TaxID=2587140 RepID=UPI0014485F50|nr:PilW family protein [Rhizobacter sp. SG703]NKI93803.1 type IV pilus assembly protein PilW [Rhizobacter sp. SG703]
MTLQTSAPPRLRQAGFSLVEMMVALTLGLVLTGVMTAVYLTSKSATRRVDQLSTLQQNVRLAFQFLSSDARMVGYQGCFTNRTSGFTNSLAVGLATNFAVGVEGYKYNLSGSALTLSSSNPADVTTAASWVNNTAGTSNTIPVTSISSVGLTPGSDVLVIRTVSGAPIRLTAAAVGSATSVSIEDNGAPGKCLDGTTSKVSGLCTGSYALIANCSSAQAFRVSSAATTLGVTGGLNASNVYPQASTEVFPLQTVVYYVRSSGSGTGTSLYRRTFDGQTTTPGAADTGVEQELIEGVENLQVRFGLDTTTEPDGVIDGSYVAANAVGDWSRVLAVRMSLLTHGPAAAEADVTLPATGKVGDVTVTYPTSGTRFDRRVFSTTVAVRNKITYASP